MHRINPWQALDALNGWALVRHEPTESGLMGWTDFEGHQISLRVDLDPFEERCTLMHELLHVQRGPALRAYEEREELWVRKATAQALLPSVEAVGDALAWAQLKVSAAAYELEVDVDVMWDRLDNLDEAEFSWLSDRLIDLVVTGP